MESIVKFIVTTMVSHPEDVKIATENENDKVVILKVNVNPDDVGRVNGKNGKVATAIRTIVKSASSKSGKKFIVKFS
jgi:predicted RNA-binding protein YlqC (UPF0109 family)